MRLTKQEILDAQDVKFEEVEVPEWGGTVGVRTLTGTERDILEDIMTLENGKKTFDNMRAKLVALAVVDEKGELVFSANDVNILGKKSAKALDRVFNTAMRMSGFSKNDVDKLTTDLSEGQSEDSTSD